MSIKWTILQSHRHEMILDIHKQKRFEPIRQKPTQRINSQRLEPK